MNTATPYTDETQRKKNRKVAVAASRKRAVNGRKMSLKGKELKAL